ncbi:hypothetical protein F183_A10380 [Bryobacterales bacterium F-183]|nr:hypothetical protein F183_A10380 [Bryobacterales bacterium F-183]
MKICYLDLYSGVSGDMLMGALVDAGVPREPILAALESFGLEAKFEFVKVRKKGIAGTKFNVYAQDDAPHRHLSKILTMIDAASIPDAAKERAKAVFQLIGKVEAGIHQMPEERVHFHEVGAIDSIADIVGVCLGFELLGADKVVASPLNVGTGMVETAHGRLPVPAPATAEILKGVPVYSNDARGELATPTGAALVASLASSFGNMPAMTIRSIGYGAGTKELPMQANMVRLVFGDTA